MVTGFFPDHNSVDDRCPALPTHGSPEQVKITRQQAVEGDAQSRADEVEGTRIDISDVIAEFIGRFLRRLRMRILSDRRQIQVPLVAKKLDALGQPQFVGGISQQNVHPPC